MENLIINLKDLRNYPVQQIDEAIEALTSYSNHYVKTNDVKKLSKVLQLQEILIDARCEKLGIIIPL